jgi:hypothetical protein
LFLFVCLFLFALLLLKKETLRLQPGSGQPLTDEGAQQVLGESHLAAWLTFQAHNRASLLVLLSLLSVLCAAAVLTCRVGRTGRAGDKEGVAITLLLAKNDAHFAGLLVNSLSLGGQEVPRELHALAMNVSFIFRGCDIQLGACRSIV